MTVRTFGVSPPDGHIFLTPPNLPWNPLRAIYPVSKHIFGTQCVQLQGSSRVGSSSCQDFAGTGGAAVWKLGSGRWGWEDKQGSWIVSHFPGTCQIGSQPQNHTVKSLLLFKVWVSQVFWLKMFFPSLFNPPLVESVESIVVKIG